MKLPVCAQMQQRSKVEWKKKYTKQFCIKILLRITKSIILFMNHLTRWRWRRWNKKKKKQRWTIFIGFKWNACVWYIALMFACWWDPKETTFSFENENIHEINICYNEMHSRAHLYSHAVIKLNYCSTPISLARSFAMSAFIKHSLNGSFVPGFNRNNKTFHIATNI